MNKNLFPDSEAESAPTKEEVRQSSLKEFNSLFPTEAECRKAVYRALNGGDEVRCKTCGSLDIVIIHNGRAGHCQSCYQVTWVTAGSFFHGVRKLRAMLMGMWLKGQGVSCNANQLSKHAGISASSALSLLKKINVVINSQMQTDPL